MFALNKSDGSVIWNHFYTGFSWPDPALSPLLVKNNLVYTKIFEQNKVIALYPETGATKWSWVNNVPGAIRWEPTIDGSNLYFLMLQNEQPYYNLVCLNAVTGHLYYKRPMNYSYYKNFTTCGSYSYLFQNGIVQNVSEKLYKFSNLTGKAIDSTTIPFGDISVVF